mmetsp:Transcript_48269/g.95276  ORF Transcript_48269/g.95276 Transcript_48269/m.95276 type:complete len:92 (-) Transcript_48269:512-787(-)
MRLHGYSISKYVQYCMSVVPIHYMHGRGRDAFFGFGSPLSRPHQLSGQSRTVRWHAQEEEEEEVCVRVCLCGLTCVFMHVDFFVCGGERGD